MAFVSFTGRPGHQDAPFFIFHRLTEAAFTVMIALISRRLLVSDTPPVIDYEGSDYQTSFWERGGRAYEDGVEAVALRRLLPPGGQRMLDLGAGAGRNVPRYQNFAQVVLLDYSLSQLQQAQHRLGESDRYIYVAANVYHLPFIPGAFDAATMVRVMHHLAEPPRALAQIQQVLTAGGTFVLEYANKQNLKAILRYALRRQRWSPFTPEPVEFVELNFDFHPRTMRRWLGEAGFTVQRQLTVSHFRIGLLKRLLPARLLVGMDAMAQLTGNWWQLTPSVFVRSQAGGAEQRLFSAAIFRCPACGSIELEETAAGMDCQGCGQHYPRQGGIYDFRYPMPAG